MRIAVHVLACAAAFVVVRAWPRASAPGSPPPPTTPVTAAPAAATAVARDPIPQAVGRTAAPRSASGTTDLGWLRNAVIMAAAEDAHRRGADLRTCLPDVELVGVTKLVFAVTVEHRAAGLVATGWRFVEVLDGQALPPTFAACAATVFGGPHALATDPALPADFAGTLDVVYLLQ